MEQGVLSYRYEREKSEAGMTAVGGLPVYLDMDGVLVETNKPVLSRSKGRRRFTAISTSNRISR